MSVEQVASAKSAGARQNSKGRRLSRSRERSDGFDADDGRDRGDLEPAPGSAEMLFDGRYIEPAADLLRTDDGELLTGYVQKSPTFELFLEFIALGFSALEDGVGMAEPIGQGFIR
jgi:hypothetical protein